MKTKGKSLKRRGERSVKKSATKGTSADDIVKDLRPVISDAQLEKITKKATTPAGKRFLAGLKPQVHEDTKTLLLLKGHRTSVHGTKILKDLNTWRKPDVILLSQNQTRLIEPMDNPEDFEYLGSKNHAPIFAMTSSTKKRPLRLFGGRLYNYKLFDLYEFDVIDYKPFDALKDGVAPVMGSKPLVVFQGALWEVSPELEGARNYFADLFGGVVAEKVFLEGFDHAYCISAYENHIEAVQKTFQEIRIDHFQIKLKKAEDGSKLPDIDMTRIGPSLTLRLARFRLPERAAVKAAHKLPLEQLVKKVKNVSTSDLLEKRAKVYVNKEDFVGLNTRHAHSKARERVLAANRSADEVETGPEGDSQDEDSEE